MRRGTLTIAIGLGALAFAAARALSRVERAIDECFGDWPHLSDEMRTGRQSLPAAGEARLVEASPSYDVRTRHRSVK